MSSLVLYIGRGRKAPLFLLYSCYMSEMKFTAIYEPAADGRYVAYVAELPGPNTQGETVEEARQNLKDAVEMLLDCLG